MSPQEQLLGADNRQMMFNILNMLGQVKACPAILAHSDRGCPSHGLTIIILRLDRVVSSVICRKRLQTHATKVLNSDSIGATLGFGLVGPQPKWLWQRHWGLLGYLSPEHLTLEHLLSIKCYNFPLSSHIFVFYLIGQIVRIWFQHFPFSAVVTL